MKYVVMCEGHCRYGCVYDDGLSAEYSGVLHDTRDEARLEMASIGRKEREEKNIRCVWIKEVEDND